MWCYHWVSIVFAVIIINRYWQQEEWSLLRSKQICAWLNKTSFIWIVGQGMLCSPWDFAAFIFFFEMSDIELRQKYWEKTLLPLLVLYFLFLWQTATSVFLLLSWCLLRPDIPRHVVLTDPGARVWLKSHGHSWFHSTLPSQQRPEQQGTVWQEVLEAKAHPSRLWALQLIPYLNYSSQELGQPYSGWA